MSNFEVNKMQALEKAVQDLHWMAYNYVNGRRTYAVTLFNDHIRELEKFGLKFGSINDSPYAVDGDFGNV